jgi:hypothetical protein
LEVKGIQETLAELNKIDPKYRRDVTKRIKNSGQIILNEARSMITTILTTALKAPRFPVCAAATSLKAKKLHGVPIKYKRVLKVKGRCTRYQRTLRDFARFTDGVQTHTEQVPFGSKPYKLMVMQQADAAGAIYDHAGRRGSSKFITNLNADGGGEQPRVIDKAVENNKPAVQSVVQSVIADVEKKTNRTLKKRYK